MLKEAIGSNKSDGISSNRHAYLIIAHNKWHQLGILLSLIDDSRNDIYVHIDKRAKDFTESIKKKLMDSVHFSKLIFIPRKNVYWADYSVADVELDLMAAASKSERYTYYHLLSGQDLPIKSQNYIHDFFKNENHEFIAMVIDGEDYVEKHTCYYHPFVGNAFYRNCKPLKAIDRGCMYVQKILGLKRIYDKNLPISTGWQWFSITDNFCQYVLAHRLFIEKMFRYTLDVDEKFMGTMMNKLGQYERLYHLNKFGGGDTGYRKGCLRKIDFYKGKKKAAPYIWGTNDTVENDYQELIGSDCLFARKFDEDENSEIIDRIVSYVKTH